MKTQGEKEPEKALSGAQSKALALLVGGATIEAAAEGAGVHPSTLHSWLKRDDFQAHYRAASRLVVDHAATQLKSAAGCAVKNLIAVCEDADAPAAARVSASKAILELAYRAVEIEDVLPRIEALERANKLR